ncbi:MAG TPA: anthrone oxygenase family protein [Candidatus Binatia bacterium]|nr:anthrone oxygenase family protein [Candidatus Binatia bacterium]
MSGAEGRGGATRIAERLATFLLGLLAGAMLAIAVALVPYWTTLPPAELRAWFRMHAPRIGRLMFPLGGGAALATLVVAALARRAEPKRRGWLWLAGAAVLGVVVVTATVNEPINEALWGPGTLSEAETARLIAAWGPWHLVRVGCGVLGFYAALRALDA